MTKGRLEAFSDAVIAIILTIMVLELKVPHNPNWDALRPLFPVLLSYVLSFVYLGIYWNNHHHLFQAVKHVRGGVLWANLHLLFWLSLVPFVSGWMGENHFDKAPTALYGVVLLGAAISYTIMVQVLIRSHGPESALAKAIGRDAKGWISLLCYVSAIPLAFVMPVLSGLIYVAVAIIWLVPDRRIERVIDHKDSA
ncbi:MAG: DUF1211 domain-containing protein [Chlorobia bacterium]|nr:DUF1211 domain-containing protein [Fimbriimonadaceae bacterium]